MGRKNKKQVSTAPYRMSANTTSLARMPWQKPPTITVAEADDLWVPNPGGQQQFMDDYTHRYCAFAGGWFAGKSWAGARKLLDLHVYNAFDLSTNQPTYVKSAAIAPTYQLAGDINIPHLRQAAEEMGLGCKFMGDKTQFKFILPDLGTKNNQSEIIVRTADSPEKITGWTVGAIWGDEVARWQTDTEDPIRDPFVQANGRLRDPRANFQQFMLTFTHEGDVTRVFRDFEEDPKTDHVLYRGASIENPHAVDFVREQKQYLSKDLAEQYLHGNAISLRGGAMYTGFLHKQYPVGNVNKDIELRNELPLQLTMDFNINPGMHALVGQYDANGPMVTTAYEIHEKRMTTIQMLQAFKALVSRGQGWRWPRLEVYGDASKDTNAQNGKTNWDIVREWLQENFEYPWVLRIRESNPPVGDRVNSVNCALRALNGTIRYTIHPRCVRLLEDLRMMKWDGNVPDKDDKQRSHASDADGYRVHFLMPIRRIQFVGGSVKTYVQQ